MKALQNQPPLCDCRDCVGAELMAFRNYLIAIFRRERAKPQDLEDKIQETFHRALKFLANGGRFPRSQEEVRRWLGETARRVLKDSWRQSSGRGEEVRPRVVAMSRPELGSAADTRHQQCAEVFFRSLQLIADDWLEQLRKGPGDQVAATVELIYLGYTRSDAARILGVNGRTIARRLQKAAVFIRQMLS